MSDATNNELFGTIAGQGKSTVRAPKYVKALAIITCCYLVFELAFNARLLDVTGTFASVEEVTHIERWGRLITGIAATIFVYGTFLYPRLHKKGRDRATFIFWSIFWATICIGSFYVGEKSFIDRIVDRSSGEMRRNAAYLQTVTAALIDQSVAIDGIDLPPEELRTPAGKSFLSLLPFIGISTNNLSTKTEAVLHDVLQWSARKSLGSSSEAYNNTFLPSAKHVINSYNDYVEGVRRYNHALRDIPETQSRAWNDYVRSLRRQGQSPSSVPRYYWARVNNNLHMQGVPVPNGWNPSDHRTFDDVIAEKIVNESEDAFSSKTRSLVGGSLPKNLSLAAFTQVSGVQSKWREALNAPAGTHLDMNMSLETYKATVYEPVINKMVDDRFHSLVLPASAYEDGGSEAADGRQAMRGLAVPPIALGFSLLGALVHLWKSSNFLTWIAFPRFGGTKRKAVLGGLVILLALSVFLSPNEITRSTVFAYLEGQTAQNYSHLAAIGAKWVVQAEPYFYPINESIRKYILMGMTYGYHG